MGNTVGSQEFLPQVLKARKNLVLRLQKTEVDILIGSILGDGYITTKGKIQIEHSIKQEDYLIWKYKQLSSIVSGKIIYTTREKDGFKTQSCRFWTKQFFRPWRSIFYINREKVIQEEIKKYLSPLALAVWYMDDGCLRTNNSIILSTESFSTTSLSFLKYGLEERWGITPTIRSNNRLYFGSSETRKFISLIHPYIVPSMAYKVP